MSTEAFKEGTKAKNIGAKAGDRFKLVTPHFDAEAPGDVMKLIYDDGSSCPKFINTTRPDLDGNYYEWTRLAPLEKTWDTLEVGDIIIHEDGSTMKVLGVLGELVFTSFWDEHDVYGFAWTVAELKGRSDLRIKGAQSDDTREVTLDEVAEAMDIPVDKLRIKKADKS